MAVYSAKVADTALGNPTGWVPGWTFPPAGGNEGPWPPGWPPAITTPTFVAWGSGTSTAYSTDSGAVWTGVTLSSGRLGSMAGTANLAYAIRTVGSTYFQYANLTTDGSATWNTRGSLATGTTGNTSGGIAIVDTTRLIFTHYDSDGTGISVSYSDNAGNTFTEVDLATGTYPGPVVELADGTLLAFANVTSGSTCDVYTSADSGTTWGAAATSSIANTVQGAVVCTNGNVVALGNTDATGKRVVAYMSDDSGATWATTMAELGAGYSSTGAIKGYGNNVMIWAAKSGVIYTYYSVDGGATWTAGTSFGAAAAATWATVASWSGGWVCVVGSSVYAATTLTNFAATAAAPAVGTLSGIYVVEEA